MSWDNLNAWLYGIASALAGFVVLLIRKVLTNERQLELLKQQLNIQEENRKERDSQIQSQLSELRTDIKIIMREER